MSDVIAQNEVSFGPHAALAGKLTWACSATFTAAPVLYVLSTFVMGPTGLADGLLAGSLGLAAVIGLVGIGISADAGH